ncbi:hypothetical protein Ancab_011196, partial [Ancistrocladus abbreviatus]
MVAERGCIVSGAPQKRVLAHEAIGGFWSHCGWNSTLDSVCDGVLLLCRPFFGDQFVNAKDVTGSWKVGSELEEGKFERVDMYKKIDDREGMRGDERKGSDFEGE